MADGKSSTQIVLDAVRELQGLGQVATRETVQCMTGLKMGIVDDRLKHLVGEDFIRRAGRGLYVVALKPDNARPISQTRLPDGTVVLDIGDEVLHLTPTEARALGGMLAGAAVQAAQIELGHQATVVNAELALKVRRLESTVDAMRRELRMTDTPQLTLLDVCQANA
ncbi:hypothetical protein ACF8C6_08995 [Pseudomonas sp. zbq_18]|uniref:hypothetical protein n=1 Tax=Pseudomonas sp. zbq_18 TaxID=3367251 RepID=UPI00370AFA51